MKYRQIKRNTYAYIIYVNVQVTIWKLNLENNSKFRKCIIHLKNESHKCHIKFQTSDNSLKTGLKITEFTILIFIKNKKFQSSMSN